MGKAIANGFPLAAVGGRAELMAGVRAHLDLLHARHRVRRRSPRPARRSACWQARRVPEQLGRIGAWLMDGLRGLAERHPSHVRGVGGLPEMCCLLFHDEAVGARARGRGGAARSAVQAKSRTTSSRMAHGEREVERAVGVLGEVLGGLGS